MPTMPVHDHTHTHPRALAKSSYRHVCAPACTHPPAQPHLHAHTGAAQPTPACTYPPAALLYSEAHDPRAGFSTHALAPTAVPPPTHACPQQDPHGPQAGADTSTGASARHARLRRSSALARASTGACAPGPRSSTFARTARTTRTLALAPAPVHARLPAPALARPARWRRHQYRHMHARLHRPTALAHTRGPHTYQRAQRDGADYGRTPLWAVARTVGLRTSVGGGAARSGVRWQRAAACTVAADSAHASWT
ncbi:hypothetical protein GGX14DRAFT_648558 [Mycena pura]|uniref:Uncharacterized protein n=1 Tax=Mycena pura TaxID=153505 RepID=A0AAD7E1R9_9AGAR|nr:hypothetical protein GGX14DRAFT_648558 [Mycena pura]